MDIRIEPPGPDWFVVNREGRQEPTCVPSSIERIYIDGRLIYRRPEDQPDDATIVARVLAALAGGDET